MTDSEMITTLRTAFTQINTMDPEGAAYVGLCDILDNADDDALKAVHAAGIKFVSQLAFNRMIRRGLVPTAPSMDCRLVRTGRNSYRAAR